VTDAAGDGGLGGGAQQAHDGLAVHGVERASRLVGERQPTLADDRPRDRDALTLAARELVRVAIRVLRDVELLHRLQGGARAAFDETPSSSTGRVTFSAAVSPGSRLKSWTT
jgi:hypothetical protein